MTAKKGSLTFPSNPLAAMQELAQLDVPSSSPLDATPLIQETDILTSRHQAILTESNQDIKTSGNQSVQQDSKPDDLKDVNPASQMESKTDRKPSRQKASKPQSETAELDPLDLVLLQKLSRAYPDFAKGKSTLVSSRLPDDLVERLGLAADLVKKHKKNKQDVIARGLILAFQELVDADGAVEWYE